MDDEGFDVTGENSEKLNSDSESIENLTKEIEKLKADLIRQEHRILPMLNNFRKSLFTYDKEDPKKKAGISAFFTNLLFNYFFIAITGGIIGLLTLVLLYFQYEEFKNQNNLLSTQMAKSELRALQTQLFETRSKDNRVTYLQEYISLYKKLYPTKQPKVVGLDLSLISVIDDSLSFKDVEFINTDFRGTKFISVDFTNTIFSRCKLQGKSSKDYIFFRDTRYFKTLLEAQIDTSFFNSKAFYPTIFFNSKLNKTKFRHNSELFGALFIHNSGKAEVEIEIPNLTLCQIINTEFEYAGDYGLDFDLFGINNVDRDTISIEDFANLEYQKSKDLIFEEIDKVINQASSEKSLKEMFGSKKWFSNVEKGFLLNTFTPVVINNDSSFGDLDFIKDKGFSIDELLLWSRFDNFVVKYYQKEFLISFGNLGPHSKAYYYPTPME